MRIDLAPSAGVRFFPEDSLSVKLLVRNACSGSGKNSGRARLWYGDAAANIRFDAAIGSAATYYLVDASALTMAPGPGPKKTIDISVGAKCGPYVIVGNWSRSPPNQTIGGSRYQQRGFDNRYEGAWRASEFYSRL